MIELLAVKGLEKTTPGFKKKLIRVCQELDLNPSYVAAVISFETAGTFSPSIENPLSGATGLIQFLPSTAEHLGTSVSQLSKMSAAKQLTYVALYYNGIGPSRIVTPLDYYLAVFSPAFIGKPYNEPMYVSGQKAYEQNKGLDVDSDGTITVGDVGQRFLSVINSAEYKPPIIVKDPTTVGQTGLFAGVTILALAITIYSLSTFTKSVHHYEASR